MQRNESATTDGIARTPSRRAVLSLGAAGVVSTLAGCSAITGEPPSSSNQDAEGPFTGTAFEGRDLVVELRENHGIEQLNLIGPDGSEFVSSEVKTGETRVSLTLLKISGGNSEHYPIGSSTLVAVQDDGEVTRDVDLVPKLRITQAEQCSGDEPKAYGNVRLTVSNSGSAPTWVYDVYYEDAPNQTASTTSDGRGTPTLFLKRPDSKAETIIPPGESQGFVGQYPPFIFSNRDACQMKDYTATAIVKTGARNSLQSQIKASFSGNAIRADAVGFGEQYACKSGSIEIIQNNGQ